MKIEILLTAIFLIAGTQSKMSTEEIYKIWSNLSAPYFSECVTRANISPEYTKEIVINAFAPDEENVKEFFDCIYVAMNFFQEDGEFSKERLVGTTVYMTEELVNKCTALTEKEVLRKDKSRTLANCIMEEVSEKV